MTVVDAATLDAGSRLAAEVVVVGSGPAGLTLAMDLRSAGVDVLVLESGSWNVDAATRDLDEGEVVGLPLRFSEVDYDTTDVRMRAIGGASGHWAGMCRPLDEIDFRERSWVPRSGWPIDRAELDPFYRRAESTLELGTTGWDPAAWFQRTGVTPLLRTDGPLETCVFQLSPPVRFSIKYEDELVAEDGPRVVAGLTAVDVERSDRRVTSVVARRADGATVEVDVGRALVLTPGGLEVPRLLLNWDGLANSSGLVGVGFAEHPHRSLGQARVNLESDVPLLYGWGAVPDDELPIGVWTGWSPRPEVQEEEGLLNSVALLRFGGLPPSGVADPTDTTGAIDGLVAWAGGRSHVATVSVRAEQAFSASSSVTLGAERDATGLRRLRLDWRVGDLDDRTARRAVELLAAEFGRAGAGRVEVDPRGRPLEESQVEIGCHPMGTARMSSDPARGVVDGDLRTHDVDNLYICSSAVFPTGGHANPTLTVVALAHRLASHLSGV